MQLNVPQSPGFFFRLAGFPVRVDAMFVLIVSLLGAGLSSDPARLAGWVAVVFVSVLWHELGHALAFRRFGIDSRIDLHTFGGVTTPVSGGSLAPRRDIAVSLAGPGAGFALGAAALLATPTGAGWPLRAGPAGPVGRRDRSGSPEATGSWRAVTSRPSPPSPVPC